ncbi:unnamed protein product [Moneuplotes crassus]|uniref:Uncharacterized protein n=1 Tax=Euplotes crassus TaxID=5936 RepID=A0AAD1Y4T5_EUPCR|nr:unnamed protein product [Moneuplotes crassus]
MNELIKENNKVPFRQILEQERQKMTQLERNLKKNDRKSSNSGIKHHLKGLKQITGHNNSLSMRRNEGIERENSFNQTQRRKKRDLSNPRNGPGTFDSIMSEDDLILDIKLKTNMKESKMQRVKNINPLKKLGEEKTHDCRKFNNESPKIKAKNSSSLSKNKSTSNSILRGIQKSPKPNHPSVKFDSKPKFLTQNIQNTHSRPKKSPMLPPNILPKNLKANSQNPSSKSPKITPKKSPLRKLIPPKIEPKGAALNAKFLNKKNSHSREKIKFSKNRSVSSHKNLTSVERLQKYKRLWAPEKSQRSESHLKRCEACRLRKKEMDEQEKKRSQETHIDFTNVGLQAMEEKKEDSVQDDIELSRKSILTTLRKKFKHECRCIDDFQGSPRHSGIFPIPKELKEVEKAKICFRPILTKRAKHIKNSNSKDLCKTENYHSEEGEKSPKSEQEVEDSPKLKYIKQKFPILQKTSLRSSLKNTLISKWEEMAKQDEEKLRSSNF